MRKVANRNKKFPKVSLIISNFNGRELLRDCLSSLLRQDYAGSYEIIVIDAGSTDGAPEMIEQEFSEVKLIKESRIGIGKAVNLGFRIARGTILAFDINSDEIFSSSWLRTLVNALLRNPDAGVVGGVRILYGTKDVIDEAGATFNYLGIPSSYIRVKLSDAPKEPRKVDYVGTLIFRRKLLDIVGLCDETYVLYSEDEDYCARVKRAGYDILHIPQAISYHRRSVTIGKDSPLSVYYERRNHVRFIIKNFPLMRMFLALFWHVSLLTAIEAIVFIPFIKRILSSKDSRLVFLSQRATRKNYRAIIEAIRWNFRKFKSTIFARQQVSRINRFIG